jgi:hypothetical protein
MVPYRASDLEGGRVFELKVVIEEEHGYLVEAAGEARGDKQGGV